MRILRLWLTQAGAKTNPPIRWLIRFAGLILVIVAGSVQAQNVCQNPGSAARGGFTLEKERICQGTPVRIVDVPSSVTNVAYNYEYSGNGTPASVSLITADSYTYTKPGSYTILQVGSGGGQATGTIACKEVTVLPTGPVSFTVSACSGRRATLNVVLDASSNQYDNYIINWGDGTRESKSRASLTATPPAHTYANNGPYTITMTGLYAAPADCPGPTQSAPAVTFNTTTQPVITRLTTLNDNSVSIQYQASSGTTVQLYQKDAGGVYAPTGQSGTGTAPFTVQTNARQEQCFQLVAQDACNAQGGLRSDAVCSLVLDAKAENKQNNLSWQPYGGTVTANQPFRYYRIYRNGTGTPPVGQINSRSTTTYSNNSRIECGTQYCYTLEAYVGPTIVTSAPTCVTGINSEVPGEFRNLTVSVENNQPRLVASLPVSGTTATYTLLITRSNGGGAFQPVGSVTNRNTFVDETANATSGSYCYQVAYQNNCGLTSPPSPPVCTVHLSSKSSTGIGWTSDSPFLTGPPTSYIVEVIDSLNGTKQEIRAGNQTTYEPDPNDPNLQSQRYRIIALSGSGVQSYSNFYTFRRKATILIPDAFTPNGDGTNDTFVIKGLFVDRFRLTIYDRWGTVIHTTTDKANGWDGLVNGQPALSGQYMYRVEVVDTTGLQTVRTGALLLVRDR